MEYSAEEIELMGNLAAPIARNFYRKLSVTLKQSISLEDLVSEGMMACIRCWKLDKREAIYVKRAIRNSLIRATSTPVGEPIIISLNAPANDDQSFTLEDKIPGINLNQQSYCQLSEQLPKLNELEHNVLSLRMEGFSFPKIAIVYGISRDKARRTYNAVKAKLNKNRN